MNAFRAELLKLRRPAVLWGAGLALPLISAVATLAVILSASDEPSTDGPSVTLGTLSRAGGLTAGFSATTAFLGILVFALYATSFGSEHSAGTLRALLTREPRRLRLLAGKWAALSVFVAATLLLALVLSSVVALALAPGQDVSTSDWFSGSGLATAAGDGANAVVSALMYGTVGAVVATLVRSGPIALGIGLAWLGPLEHLVADGWDAGNRWFPGLTFEAVAAGGTDASSFGRALGVGLLLAVVASIAGAATFVRRDVST